jgi:gas vesicle protein
MSKSGDFIGGLIVGGLIGAVIGILYAPKSGRETREDLARRADEVMAKAKEEYEIAVEKGKKAYDATLARLKAFEEAAKEKVEEAEDLAERGKESLQEGKTRLKKAIEAGVEAFREEQKKAV